MSRLLDELRADPDAVFEINGKLSSGNEMMGTVGPILGDKLMCHIQFSQDPASELDIAQAKEVMDKAIGIPHQFAAISRNATEREASAVAKRKFLGGGQG